MIKKANKKCVRKIIIKCDILESIRDRIGGDDRPREGGDFGRSMTHFLAPKAPKMGTFGNFWEKFKKRPIL